jgi:hypothetical protein
LFGEAFGLLDGAGVVPRFMLFGGTLDRLGLSCANPGPAKSREEASIDANLIRRKILAGDILASAGNRVDFDD